MHLDDEELQTAALAVQLHVFSVHRLHRHLFKKTWTRRNMRNIHLDILSLSKAKTSKPRIILCQNLEANQCPLPMPSESSISQSETGRDRGSAADAGDSAAQSGEDHSFQAVEHSKSQIEQAAWDCVTPEIITKSQALQAGKNHVFEALVEIETKSQTWQVAWQHYLFQVPVEISTQSQAEQNAWEDDSFEALVELRSKSQTL